MADAATVTFATSALPALEPLAGISFALNLAYLNLKRWRYRVEVKETAETALRGLNSKKNNNGSSLEQLDQFNGLRFLAGLTEEREGLPFFVHVFHWLYNKESDIKLSLAFSFISVILLCAGVAHDISAWGFLLPIASVGWAQFFLYVLIASLALPSGFVLTGRALAKKAKKHAAKCEAQLASVFVSKIDDVHFPSLGSGSGWPPDEPRSPSSPDIDWSDDDIL